jgi:putative tricarboxylic transport membrane protein
MLELIFPLLLGIFVGMLVGLSPGVGITTSIVFMYGFLIEQNLMFNLIFYSTLLSTTQYFGSIPTLILGIPGETTGLPLMKLREQIIKESKLEDVLFGTSIGSFFAAFFSCVLCWFLVYNFSSVLFYLKTYVVLIFSLIGFVLSIVFSDNKMYQSLLFFLFGWTCSKIGFNVQTREDFLTFNNVYLFGGLPAISVIFGIYGIPKIMDFFNLSKTNIVYEKKIESKINLIKDQKFVILRSSIIGFISGLIPFCGNYMSSFISFFVQKKITPHNNISLAISSETANNSGYISVLFPLFALGIALTPTEYIFLDILEQANISISKNNIYNSLFVVFVSLIIANFLCLVISWKMINFTIMFYRKIHLFVPIFFILFGIFTVYTSGEKYSQEIYYLIIFAIFSIIGFLFRKKDMIPFIFAFLLQNNIENSIIYTKALYF